MCTWGRCDRYARDVFQHIVHIKSRLRPEEFATYIQLLIFAKRHWDNDAAFAEMQEGRQAARLDPLPQPLHGLEAQAAACMNHDVLDDLAADRVPMPGDRRGATTSSRRRGWRRRWPRVFPAAIGTYTKAQGHAFHWECIEDFNPRVRNWLLAH